MTSFTNNILQGKSIADTVSKMESGEVRNLLHKPN